MSLIRHTWGFNNQCPGFQPLSISVMDRPSQSPSPAGTTSFPKVKEIPLVKRSLNSHPEPLSSLCLFSFLFLKALSSNKQLFQSAPLIKRNVLISPRQNIMLLCYHWSKSSKIQNKNISLIRSRSGMPLRNLPSSQVCPILRKIEELKRRGWCWGERGCQGRNTKMKTD